MNKYFSLSPNSKGDIHKLLSPIFDAVRKNKIHSYYQLRKDEDKNNHNAEEKTRSYIFDVKPKTAEYSSSKIIDAPLHR